jgi:hypothetical protein
VTCVELTLTWKPVPGATGYRVYGTYLDMQSMACTLGASARPLLSLPSSATSTTLYVPTNYPPACEAVSAFNAAGESLRVRPLSGGASGIAGAVQDAAGNPIAGLMVEACSTTHTPCTTPTTAKTDESGRYSLALPPDGYWLEVDSVTTPQDWPDGLVSATGLLVPYGGSQGVLQVAAGEQLELWLTYPKLAHVSGTVQSTSGASLTGATVNACPSAGICDNAPVASDGSYAVPVLPGVYNITVCGWAGTSDCADGPRSVKVTADLASVNITIP